MTLTFDEFNNSEIGVHWTQTAYGGGSFGEDTAYLNIGSGSGDIATTYNPNWVNQAIASAEDFCVKARFERDTDIDSNYEQAGILFAVDSNNFVKVGYGNVGGKKMICAHKVSGTYYEGLVAMDTGTWITVLLWRTGTKFGYLYSNNDEATWATFTAPGTILASSAAGSIGLFAIHPS